MDFDTSEALVMTAGGLGMAFFILVILMVFTSIMGRLLQTRSNRVSDSIESEDAQLAAATAVAVALSEHQTPKKPIEGLAASPWASQGRQEIMAARLGRERQIALRRPQTKGYEQ